MYNMASYCNVCSTEVIDDGEALECDQCIARSKSTLSDTTVSSSHDFMV